MYNKILQDKTFCEKNKTLVNKSSKIKEIYSQVEFNYINNLLDLKDVII